MEKMSKADDLQYITIRFSSTDLLGSQNPNLHSKLTS